VTVNYRPLEGFSGYRVGDDGSVWTCYTRGGRYPVGTWRPVSIYRRPYGARYCVVCLRLNDGKGKVVCRYVHRLILVAFAGPCPPGMLCCHGDGDTANNRLDNLRWDTAAANAMDTYRHGRRRTALSAETVRQIRDLRRQGFASPAIARMLGLHASTVHRAATGLTWRHVEG
jgi:hypothetical protein